MQLGRISKWMCAAILVLAAPALAQYPNRAIHVYMPGAPGGSFDTLTRLVMQKLSEQVKQPVVVENVSGAAGMLAVDRCLQAGADGYSLCIGYVGNIAIAPWLYKNMTYDPVKDLKPVALMGSVSFVLAVPASSPFKSVDDLVKYARANPGKLNYASSGNGTGGHIGGELLKKAQHLEMTHIPYQGAAPASIALLGGQVDWAFEALPTALPNVKAGKLRALAASGPRRIPDLPDVPTMQELGYKDFDLESWVGVMVAAKTPDDVVRDLNEQINKALKSPDLERAYASRGAIPIGGTPEQFAAYVKSELATYGQVIKTSQAKAD